jgi:hypothetical protein
MNSSGLEQRLVMGSCEYGNKIWAFYKSREFLNQVRNSQLLKDSARRILMNHVSLNLACLMQIKFKAYICSPKHGKPGYHTAICQEVE